MFDGMYIFLLQKKKDMKKKFHDSYDISLLVYSVNKFCKDVFLRILYAVDGSFDVAVGLWEHKSGMNIYVEFYWEDKRVLAVYMYLFTTACYVYIKNNTTND